MTTEILNCLQLLIKLDINMALNLADTHLIHVQK